MMTRRLFVGLVLLAASTIVSAQTSKPAEVSILFVGNSYTAFNGGLPKIIKQMADEAGKSIETEGSLVGGKSLEYHWNEGKARETIASKKWDIVVLQDFSTQTASKPALMHEYATKFAELVKERGARPVFYMTWARQHKPETQATITAAYQKVAAETGSDVAPVGLAWQRVLSERKDLPLHFDDKSHPNPAGTYLTACVFYEVLLGSAPPDKAPAIMNQRTKAMEELPPEVSAYLRKIASETVAQQKKKPAP